MSLTEAEATAAAAVAESIMGDYSKAGGDTPAAAPVAETATPPVAATPEPTVLSSPPAAAPAAETTTDTEATELPSFDPEIPEDLQELLDTPDFDAEAEAEVQAEIERDPDVNEYLDTDAEKEKRALKKRNAWLEQQLVERSRKNWVAENLRAYPLLRTYAKDQVEAIKATSRRAFAREAAALNGKLEEIARPMLADIAKLKAEAKGEALAEGKQEAKTRWGNAPGDVPGTGASTEHAEKLAAAEKTGNLRDVFKVMLEETPLAVQPQRG